jgi:hypothetical protein
MADAISQAEQTFVENEFGTVTSRRVIYYREKGWFSGGSREDIPLQHVTSVRLETSRSIVGGIFLLVLGVVFLAGGGVMKLLGVVFIVLAVLFLWGSPKVVVNTAGQDLNAAKGFPWKRSEATSFVEALRTQLFNKSGA